IFTGIFLFSGNLFAQNPIKLGHIDSRLVFAAMPESDSATKQLEREAAVMQQTLEELQVEFNRKFEEYQRLSNDPNTSRVIINTKEEELQSLNQRSQTFQQQAEQSIAEKRQQLFEPIQEKAIKAVNEVAAENGFTYIFDTAGGMIVYSSPDSQDILSLVKTKLGLK
ncbi:MAG TPA: OmpH family outer membrane protein, partial [Bacteroidales bacterium]|nr:OmpH family outer membrane protein [Bacteroidales bacterium]